MTITAVRHNRENDAIEKFVCGECSKRIFKAMSCCACFDLNGAGGIKPIAASISDICLSLRADWSALYLPTGHRSSSYVFKIVDQLKLLKACFFALEPSSFLNSLFVISSFNLSTDFYHLNSILIDLR